jgi:uncharacterized protein (DUF433 family)
VGGWPLENSLAQRYNGDNLPGGVSMVQATDYLYVVRDDEVLNGEPIIRGTRTPIRAIVETWRMGIAPEEIPKGMPHLTLGQIFGALTYYSDHREEINQYIEKNQISDDLIDPLVRDL